MTSSVNRNHPAKGSVIKAEPIRNRDSIQKIKAALYRNPRDYCLFVLGINTAFRAGELLSLNCGQVAHLCAGDELELLQQKTGKRRSVTLNKVAVNAISRWLREHPNPVAASPLFQSRRGGALQVSTVSNMVKLWCESAGLKGNYASHTMRKTWGFHQARSDSHLNKQMIMPRLMKAFGHSSEAQTMRYLCISNAEVSALYLGLEL